MYRRITIISSTQPSNDAINEQLLWIAGSLGLFNLRDKNKSCFRVFIELLKTAKRGEAISSDALAAQLQLSRGTVVHHLHKLRESGLVIEEENTYIMRVSSLHELISLVEQDLLQTCEEIKRVARDVDGKLK